MRGSYSSALAFRAPSHPSGVSGELRKRSHEGSTCLDQHSQVEAPVFTEPPYSPSIYEEDKVDFPVLLLTEPTPTSEHPPSIAPPSNFDLLHPDTVSLQTDRHLERITEHEMTMPASSSRTSHADTAHKLNPASSHLYQSNLSSYQTQITSPSFQYNEHRQYTQDHARFSIRMLPQVPHGEDEESLPLIPPIPPTKPPRRRFQQPTTSPRLGAVVTFADIADAARGISGPIFSSIGRNTANFTQKFPRVRRSSRQVGKGIAGTSQKTTNTTRDVEAEGYGLDGDSLSIGRWTGSKWLLVSSVVLV